MTELVEDPRVENTREKILRKCRESIERWRPFSGVGRLLLRCSFLQHPRIQEVHGIMVHILWDLIHLALGEEDVI